MTAADAGRQVGGELAGITAAEAGWNYPVRAD